MARIPTARLAAGLPPRRSAAFPFVPVHLGHSVVESFFMALILLEIADREKEVPTGGWKIA
jgi:hypothetical protein